MGILLQSVYTQNQKICFLRVPIPLKQDSDHYRDTVKCLYDWTVVTVVTIKRYFAIFEFNANSIWIEQSHKPYNAPVPYPTVYHSRQKCAHFCSELRLGGYRTGTLWDFWIRSIACIITNPGPQVINIRSSGLEMSQDLGAVSIRKTVLQGMAIPMLKIRRPNGKSPYVDKTVFILRRGPGCKASRGLATRGPDPDGHPL